MAPTLLRKTRKVATLVRCSPEIASTYFYAARNRMIHGARIEQAPAFVVGCGHSGTTLLPRILNAHSRIYSVPFESNIGTRCNLAARYLMRYFERCTIADRKVRWIEKTPNHINCIDRLWELANDAKIILMIRDGRDVACSIRNRFGDFRLGIQRWVNDNGSGEPYWNHPSVHVLHYEDLVQDFRGTLGAVLDFIGESFELQLESYHTVSATRASRKSEKPESASGKAHEQLRNWQIRQPLFDGRGKWKSMSEIEKDMFKSMAGDMLIRYGYASDNDW